MGYSVTEMSEEEDNDYISPSTSVGPSTILDIPTANNNDRVNPGVPQDERRRRRGDEMT
jgi:hypothetical protein